MNRPEVVEMPMVVRRDDDFDTNTNLSSRKQSWSRRQLMRMSAAFGDAKPSKSEAPRMTYRKSEIQRWRDVSKVPQSPGDGGEWVECLKITNPSAVNRTNAATLRNVKSLAIEDSDGDLTELPASLAPLYPALTSFKLTWSQVRCVPHTLLQSGLRALDLEENQLQTIEKIESAISLERLNLRNNQLHSLPDEVGSLSRLRTLDLSRNRLKDLPNSIGSLHSLVHLDVSQNKLKSLPSSLGSLKRLKFLGVSHNQLTDFPPTLSLLVGLEDLQASSNSLCSLSYAFQSLESLRSLLLSKNSFKSLPTCLCSLPRLEHLCLSGNRLQFVSEPLAAVRTLNVDGNQFTEIPRSIVGSPMIEHLWMRNNQLTSLPEEMSAMRSLRSLHLDGNQQLRELPPSLAKMKSLEHLYLQETDVRPKDPVVLEVSGKASVHLDGQVVGGPERPEEQPPRESSVTPEMLKVSRFCSFHSGRSCQCNGRLHPSLPDDGELKVVLDMDSDGDEELVL